MRDIEIRAALSTARLTPHLVGAFGLGANMLLVKLVDLATRARHESYTEISGRANVGVVVGAQRWLTDAVGLGTSTATLVRYLRSLEQLGVIDLQHAWRAWSQRRRGTVIVDYEAIVRLADEPVGAMIHGRSSRSTMDRQSEFGEGHDVILGDLKDPPIVPHGGTSLDDLEDLLVACIPEHAGAVRPESLDDISRALLARLVGEHGAETVEQVIREECGGYFVPVGRLRDVLRRRARDEERERRPAKRRRRGATSPARNDCPTPAPARAPEPIVELDPQPVPDASAQAVADRIGLDLPHDAVPVATDGRTVTVWTPSPWSLDDWLRADDRRFSQPVDECTAILGTDERRPDPESVLRRPVAQAQSVERPLTQGTGWGNIDGPQGALSWV